MRSVTHANLFWFFVAILVIAGVLLWPAISARAHHSEYHDWLLSWIPGNCCVTNDCCRPISSTNIRAVGPDEYLIIASGQVIKRTGWSPDGTIIRCACDHIDGKWTVHPTAFTRCLYMPMPNS